jgi:hypothetical protein
VRLLFSTAFSSAMLTFFLPAGNWGGFVLAFRGTNGLTPKARADVGNVNLTWNGVPLVNVDFELLQYLTDLKGGFSLFTSTASSTFETMCYIPAGNFTDKNNIYRIDNDEKVYFKLDFPNLADITGQVYIYGIPKEGIMNYQYCLTSRNVTAGASGTISDVHRLNNVSAIYLKNYSAVSDMQILRDGKTIVDGILADIKAISDFTNQVETSASVIEVDMNRSKDIREIISSEINFKYTFSGASTLQQYFAYSILTPQQARKSLVAFESEVRQKIENGYKVPESFAPEKRLPALS